MQILVTLLYVVITAALALLPFYVLIRRFKGKKQEAQWKHVVTSFVSSAIIFFLLSYLAEIVDNWVRSNVINSGWILNASTDGFLLSILFVSFIYLTLPWKLHETIHVPVSKRGIVFFTSLLLLLLVLVYYGIILIGLYQLNYESFP